MLEFLKIDSLIIMTLLLLLGNAASIIKKVIGTGPDIGHQMHYLISTGNLASRSGLGLQQVCTQRKLAIDILLTLVITLCSYAPISYHKVSFNSLTIHTVEHL